jgi:hypothetical protein
MKSKNNILIGLVLLTSIFLASCQSTGSIENTATPDKSTAAATDKPTNTTTVQPTETATIHPTVTASVTFTETAVSDENMTVDNVEEAQVTPTATVMKIADWNSASFFTSGSLPHWQYFIALQFDGQISGNYYAVVDKNKNYDCEILPMYADRLYCDGPQAAFMDFVKFQVFNADTDEQVYEEHIWIPGSFYTGD